MTPQCVCEQQATAGAIGYHCDVHGWQECRPAMRWRVQERPTAMLLPLCPGCHIEMMPLPQTMEVVCRQSGCQYQGVRFHAPTVELVPSE